MTSQHEQHTPKPQQPNLQVEAQHVVKLQLWPTRIQNTKSLLTSNQQLTQHKANPTKHASARGNQHFTNT